MTIKKSLNALLDDPNQGRQRLPAAATRTTISARVGRSSADQTGPASVLPGLYAQVIGVYSVIVVTEAGAFEKPPGWPSDGTYPGIVGTELNPDEPYYEQKRVHAAYFDTQTGLLTQINYLINLEAPYSGLLNSLEAVDQDIVALYKEVLADGASAELVDAVAAQLTDLGIV